MGFRLGLALRGRQLRGGVHALQFDGLRRRCRECGDVGEGDCGLGRYVLAFASCLSMISIDFFGSDETELEDVLHCFFGCSAFTIIWTDADWALLSGVWDSQRSISAERFRAAWRLLAI